MRDLVVIRHLPGERWDPTVDARDQAGIHAHVEYWSAEREDMKVLLGGPFVDGSGGMMIVEGDLRAVERVALRDPTVVDHLLYPDIRFWKAVIGDPDVLRERPG